MQRFAPSWRKLSRSTSIMTLIGALAAMLTFSGTVAAHPSTDTTLTYRFTDCAGPAGTPVSFDAVKQPGSAAALHLLDGSGIFIAVEAIDVATGTVLFTTPGFQHNVVPTVSCQIIHPVTQNQQSVKGFIAPGG